MPGPDALPAGRGPVLRHRWRRTSNPGGRATTGVRNQLAAIVHEPEQQCKQILEILYAGRRVSAKG